MVILFVLVLVLVSLFIVTACCCFHSFHFFFMHVDISGFKNTKVVMDEGQFLTKVLPTGKTFGGFSKFAFDSRAHLTEAHHLNTKENSDQLFADWSRYWNLSKPVLMEKSPPHTMQLRLLNALFKDKGERYFLVVQRHPVATTLAIMFWGKKPRALTKKDEVNFWSLIEHWLIQNERMREDATFLDNVVVVRYEEFMAYPQDYLLYLHRWLGVKPDPLRQKLTDSTNDKYYNALLSSCNLFEGRQGVCNDKTIRYTSIDSRSKYQELKERVESFGYSMEDPFSLPEVPCSGKLLPHERLWCDRLITPTMLLHGPTK
ncbi:Sulfotransferase, variant 2 [Balamuthia mandrillaris]